MAVVVEASHKLLFLLPSFSLCVCTSACTYGRTSLSQGVGVPNYKVNYLSALIALRAAQVQFTLEVARAVGLDLLFSSNAHGTGAEVGR